MNEEAFVDTYCPRMHFDYHPYAQLFQKRNARTGMALM